MTRSVLSDSETLGRWEMTGGSTEPGPAKEVKTHRARIQSWVGGEHGVYVGAG